MAEPKRLNGEELKGGVPPGKATLWVVDGDGHNISGYFRYDHPEDAINDLLPKLREFKGRKAIVNAKREDGEELGVWVLSLQVLPKIKPSCFERWLRRFFVDWKF